jgi:hypothetical protein
MGGEVRGTPRGPPRRRRPDGLPGRKRSARDTKRDDVEDLDEEAWWACRLTERVYTYSKLAAVRTEGSGVRRRAPAPRRWRK